MKPTGPTNPIMKKMIEDLRTHGYKEKNKFKIKLARMLERPRRKNNPVTLSKLERVCNDGESIIVPGKVLSSGDINKKLKIYAKAFSGSSKHKIEKAGGKALTINELLKENPKGKNVRFVV